MSSAQDGVRWEAVSLQVAQQRAAQTRRLVLVHFWSPNCGPCQKMERLVFSRPDVAAAIETYYVPVKINADQFPYTARQFGITALPTDLILSPNGQVIRRFQGAVPAEQYIAQLHQVAMQMQLAGAGPAGWTGGGLPSSGGQNTLPAQSPSSGGAPLGIVSAPASGPNSLGVSPNPPGWQPSWNQAAGPIDQSGTPSSPGGWQYPTPSEPAVGRDREVRPEGPATSFPTSPAPSIGGVGLGNPVSGWPEHPVPPLAERSMVPVSNGQTAGVASSVGKPSVPGGPSSGNEAVTQQRGISANLPMRSELVRPENGPPFLERKGQAAGSQPMQEGLPAGSGESVGGWPPGLPPLGLEGYCPVELVEKRRWVLGTHPWGVIHEGRTYMCAGPEEQKKFLADPQRYAPVLSGNDVVWAVEHGQQVPGRREYGVFYRGRIYLFAEPGTLDAFRKNPRRYLEAISGISSSPGSETASRR